MLATEWIANIKNDAEKARAPERKLGGNQEFTNEGRLGEKLAPLENSQCR